MRQLGPSLSNVSNVMLLPTLAAPEDYAQPTAGTPTIRVGHLSAGSLIWSAPQRDSSQTMKTALRSLPRLLLTALFLLPLASAADQYIDQLPALNIDIAETSVSGISSGGFLAAQFGIAHSAMVKGVGVVAAGPYYCARGSVSTAMERCSCTSTDRDSCDFSETSANVSELVKITRDLSQRTYIPAGTRHARPVIDDPANVAKQRVISVFCARDTKTPLAIGRQLLQYYLDLGIQPANFKAEKPLPDAAHTMPTVGYGGACSDEKTPFIGRCGYDTAKEILSWIYNEHPLSPAGSRPAGEFYRFKQAQYVPGEWRSPFFLWASGLDSTGWAYIPNSCQRGEACRVHIVLHGCKQGQTFVPLSRAPGSPLYYGDQFVKHTGYDRWADNNRLVILFPQAVSIPNRNGFGCWDWFGYTGKDYATQEGVQIRTLKAMVDRLASGRH